MQITEGAVRRLAKREGYVLQNCTSRNPDYLGCGGYVLIEPERSFAVLGTTPLAYSANLEEIQDWLKD